MSNLKPSLIAKVERSIGEAEHCFEELKMEESIDKDFDHQLFIASQKDFAPLLRCNTDEFNEAFGIIADPPFDKESLLKSSDYTGFTISVKEDKEEQRKLRLARGPLIENLKTLLVVDKDDQEAKNVEPLDFFTKTEVLRATVLEPDPYSGVNNVRSGLEVVIRKGDGNVKYCFMSHEFCEWKILDQSEESKGDSNSWLVDAAEIVRVKDKGPYIRLSIDEEHNVFFCPRIPDLQMEKLHRFMTE